MESEPYYNVFRTYTSCDSYQQHFSPGLQAAPCGVLHADWHGYGYELHEAPPQWEQHVTPVNMSDKKSPPYYISKAHDVKRTRSLKTEPSCQPNNIAGLKKSFQSYLGKLFHRETKETSLRLVSDAAVHSTQVKSPEWPTAGTCKTWQP